MIDVRGPELLLLSEVAEALRIPESTLRYWRATNSGPPSFKVGRKVVYQRDALGAWLEERRTAEDTVEETHA